MSSGRTRVTIVLSGQQQDALRAIQAGDGQTFRLSGAAGTGKTTLIRHIIATNPALTIQVCAPTNRAAAVLRAKSVATARTLHSALYAVSEEELLHILADIEAAIIDLQLEQPSPENDALLRHLDEQARDLEDQIAMLKQHDRNATRPVFFLREEGNPLSSANMLIIDESSMVTNEVYEDALTALPDGARVVAVGDHRQLPPVSKGDRGFFLEASPDFKLTEPFRVHGQDSDLLRITTRAFEPGLDDSTEALLTLCRDIQGDGSVVHFGSRTPPAHTWKNADIIITHTNKTRHLANRAKRNLLGISGNPQPGEPVISLTKNDAAGIAKGEILRIKSISPCTERPKHQWDVELEIDGSMFHTKMLREGFTMVNDAIDDPAITRPKDYTALHYGVRAPGWFTFAYAVTCHGAQGGEWDRVLVLDEQAYRSRRFQDGSAREDRRRWRYTAITRAKMQLAVVNWAPWHSPPTIRKA